MSKASIAGLFGSSTPAAVFLRRLRRAVARNSAADLEAMGWSRAGALAAATLDFLFMGFAAFAWGTLSDNLARIVVLSGSLLLGLGLVTAGRAQGSGGLAAGGGLVGIAARWRLYDDGGQQRLNPQGGVAASRSRWYDPAPTSPTTVAPSAGALITAYDWRTAMLVVGARRVELLIPASFLVRPAPKSADDAARRMTTASTGRMDAAQEAFAAVHRVRGRAFRLLRGAFRTDLPR